MKVPPRGGRESESARTAALLPISARHSSVRVGPGGVRSERSQLVVELELIGQVDPAEDESGQGQGEQHDEDH